MQYAYSLTFQALEGAAGVGVPIVLQFVGLSVPDEMHCKQEQLGDTVTAAYYKVRQSLLSKFAFRCLVVSGARMCHTAYSTNTAYSVFNAYFTVLNVPNDCMSHPWPGVMHGKQEQRACHSS